ncbi:testicular haploid expressed gene protein-like isoform X2 [Lingula anatina]|uniref:Testicular haploid expressed gene protein-like isoform X2 n=1 Tax=Lingula anatina TaxID=7574 RepID=A0A1S3HGF7_LINAN|nr:testicular haploid expressed gene protein-like isoform X2 [Lingula anatina]|eukprot:XP_013385150.1 testicular haploid expressed gene protein-like isoform X2 [Lingula anatina]
MAGVAVQPRAFPFYDSERIFELAHPKESKAIWQTSFGPRVLWGTQDMLWPISADALKTQATARVIQLANPKKNFQTGIRVNRPQYEVGSCGRASVIWEVSPLAQKAEPSERLCVLAYPKKPLKEYLEKEDRRSFAYSCGRVSPIWELSEAAKQCEERPRTSNLSRPKSVHPDFQGEREIATIIPKPALTHAKCTERLEFLARPKSRKEGPFREPQWPVAKTAMSFNASNRQLELAKPKTLPEGFQPNREDPQWRISRASKKAIAGVRLNELSVPIIRATMDHVQFDPDAFLVKEAALKAVCSRRTEELAQPIQR